MDIPKWIVDVSVIATLIGFCMTVYVSYGMKKLSGRYKRRARLPEIIESLSSCTEELIRFIDRYDHNDDHYHRSKTIVKKINSNFNSLIKIVDKKNKQSISDLEEVIREYNSSCSAGYRKDKIWRIHNDTVGLIYMLESVTLDEQWS
jgi:DNA topoisomerase VI subunit B